MYRRKLRGFAQFFNRAFRSRKPPASPRYDLELDEERRLREVQRNFEDQGTSLGRLLAIVERALRDQTALAVRQRGHMMALLLTTCFGLVSTAFDVALNAPTGLHYAQIEVENLAAASHFQIVLAVGMVGGLVVASIAASGVALASNLIWKVLGTGALLAFALLGAADRAGVIALLGKGVQGEEVNLVLAGTLFLASICTPLTGAWCFDRALTAWTRLLDCREILKRHEVEVAAVRKDLATAQTGAAIAVAERFALRDGWTGDRATTAPAEEPDDIFDGTSDDDNLIALPTNDDDDPEPRNPAVAAQDSESTLSRTSGWVMLGLILVIGFSAYGMAGCTAPTPQPAAHVFLVRDDTSGPGPSGQVEAAELDRVVDKFVTSHPPMGSSVTLVVPGKDGRVALAETLELRPNRATTDPRLVRAAFEPKLRELVAAPAPPEAVGSSLFASLTIGLRDASHRPTAIVIVSDLEEVSSYGRKRLNFERPPLPEAEALRALLADEHVLPDLTGIPVEVCGLDTMLTPKSQHALTTLWDTTLRAAGAVAVDVHPHCADRSAPTR